MNILQVNGLTKQFGGLTAVNDVTFDVERGSITGLIGPNGAGKTTIFNLVTGVYKVTGGKIVFDGKEIQNEEAFKIANMGITRTFQNIRLFKRLTVYENVLTACQYNANYSLFEAMVFGLVPKKIKRNSRFYREEKLLKEQAEELMEILGLQDRRNFIANNLPYGFQRRLEIARALALRPKLLLLDEPAAGMNPEETEKLTELIAFIRDKFDLSVLLIEHHMDLVMEICDKIVVLNFGCKLAEGTPKEIQQNPEVQKAYLGGGNNA
ncbi:MULTISPECIES: ABC transporter ATP-binding protein [Caloramator]|uniref:Branched-chain amino acid transport ATP-binding protein LivG (TC 3.A.1.4.1) n=1 Tax=Caloramator australicus RC3 TaxID=857293 RepID=I7KVY4_9CLOT|nr:MULTISPECIES: ABC transporter ATP-binding protein [Caloramator]WDU82009.1 ABC transporter ATP-binding protein [Caloramator sp. Dgby_cultured_2]CCJ34264.1 Branched-chain amino acid transport ATP-binding protein LivG (TC 3.A.1.4.1) [Caloramator australicus RC3]